MSFDIVDFDATATDLLAAELELLAQAAAGRCVAQIWQAPRALVAPRSYLRFAGLERARADFAQRGCPVFLRLSGGGLVPQGPGILNLSLAYPVRGTAGTLSAAVYRHLCEILQQTLQTLGLRTHRHAVAGSFCDGRFNLTWDVPGDARKIAGTAQYWRRVAPAAPNMPSPSYAVLAHAVLLVSPDPQEITQCANAFEAAIGSGQQYRADRIISVQQALARTGKAPPERLMDTLVATLRAHVIAASPPGQGSAHSARTGTRLKRPQPFAAPAAK